mmetsp:Transcript_36110/g.72441  ORF Transcript_36110/g.72441 Transcript_36110/m.72441 type:complete len:344 (+) Transcript_36110:96-1127(+)
MSTHQTWSSPSSCAETSSSSHTMYSSAATPNAVHPTSAGSFAARAFAASPPIADPITSMTGPATTAGTALCLGWVVHAAAKVRPRKPISTAIAAAMNKPALCPVTRARPTSSPSMAESMYTAIANTQGKGGLGCVMRLHAPATIDCRTCGSPSAEPLVGGDDVRRPRCVSGSPLTSVILVDRRSWASAASSGAARRGAPSSWSPPPSDASESPSSMMTDIPIMTETPRQNPTIKPVMEGLPLAAARGGTSSMDIAHSIMPAARCCKACARIFGGGVGDRTVTKLPISMIPAGMEAKSTLCFATSSAGSGSSMVLYEKNECICPPSASTSMVVLVAWDSVPLRA